MRQPASQRIMAAPVSRWFAAFAVAVGCVRPPPAPVVVAAAPCAELHACAVACGTGHDPDCETLRAIALELPAVEREVPRAAAENGCVAGAGAGCALAGELWHAVDRRTAGPWLDAGCTRGHSPLACGAFAEALSDGVGAPRDPDRARALAAPLAERGDARGCRVAGHQAEQVHDDVNAVRGYSLGCDRGDAAACVALGDRHDRADDEAGATIRYDRACALGEPRGCAAAAAVRDRVHPTERSRVRVFEVSYADPAFGRSASEALRLADGAIDQLRRGVSFERVAAAYGDQTVREQVVVRVNTPSTLQDAAFGLLPGFAAVVAVPAYGYLVVQRIE